MRFILFFSLLFSFSVQAQDTIENRQIGLLSTVSADDDRYTVLEGYRFVTEQGIRALSEYLLNNHLKAPLFWSFVESILTLPKASRTELWNDFKSHALGPRSDAERLEGLIFLADPIVNDKAPTLGAAELFNRAATLCDEDNSNIELARKACSGLGKVIIFTGLDDDLKSKSWSNLWSRFNAPAGISDLLQYIFQREKIFASEENSAIYSYGTVTDRIGPSAATMPMTFSVNISALAGRDSGDHLEGTGISLFNHITRSECSYDAGGSTRSEAYVDVVELQTKNIDNDTREISYQIGSFAKGGYREAKGFLGFQEKAETGTSNISYDIVGALELPKCENLAECDPATLVGYQDKANYPIGGTTELQIDGDTVPLGQSVIVDRMKGSRQVTLRLRRNLTHRGRDNFLERQVHIGTIKIQPVERLGLPFLPDARFSGIGSHLKKVYLTNFSEIFKYRDWDKLNRSVLVPLYLAKKMTEGSYELNPEDFYELSEILKMFKRDQAPKIIQEIDHSIRAMISEQSKLPLKSLLSAIQSLSTVTLSEANLELVRKTLAGLLVNRSIDPQVEYTEMGNVSDYEKLVFTLIRIQEAFRLLKIQSDHLEAQIQYLRLVKEAL